MTLIYVCGNQREIGFCVQGSYRRKIKIYRMFTKDCKNFLGVAVLVKITQSHNKFWSKVLFSALQDMIFI